MSLLISVLPRIPQIITLYSQLKFEFDECRRGVINENQLIHSTEETRNALLVKTRELVEIINGEQIEVLLARSCADLANRIQSQATLIVNSIAQKNLPAVLAGLQQIDSNTLVLLSRLSVHYEQIAAISQREQTVAECLKKAFKLIRENPPPVFEDDFDEYRNIAKGANIEYSSDARALLNRKMLNFPGMTKFIAHLSEINERQHMLNLARSFNEANSAAIDPLPRNFHELLPCVSLVDSQCYTSQEEARTDLVKFFKNGNWLESYVFLKLEKAGCSTRLLNVTLSSGDTLIEADVLAIYSGNLIIFETKDRAFGNGLTDDDTEDVTKKIEKIGNLENPNVKLNFVINISDDHKEAVKMKIEEISSSKGVEAKIIFLDNQGSIDNIIAKIRMCLR